MKTLLEENPTIKKAFDDRLESNIQSIKNILKLTVDDNDKMTLLKSEIDKLRLELGQPEAISIELTC